MNITTFLATLAISNPMLWFGTVIEPPEGTAPAAGATFENHTFDALLRQHVDNTGRVDYSALRAALGDLDTFYRQISAYSPDSHPELFPDEDARLAYWINAYNAAVLKAVLTYYPIQTVNDVKLPWLLSFLSKQSGFFYFQHLRFGGTKISLYNLEHNVVCGRFPDPRIHFALNCASLGCPKLSARAFTAENLQSELDAVTWKFMAESRNLRIDHGECVIYISSILSWHEENFLGWLRTNHPEIKTPEILDYVQLYVADADEYAAARAEGYEVRVVPYDWRLNDQAADY
ncbi:MAG: DUF547 domain-containing protein [Candidatus Latescibacterota bacterium]|nr:DUF547 domain-containing protein [Candidatus Latescibacterota bacterium]